MFKVFKDVWESRGGRERTRQVDRPAWEKAERSNAGQCVHPVWALGQQKENEYSYAKE